MLTRLFSTRRTTLGLLVAPLLVVGMVIQLGATNSASATATGVKALVAPKAVNEVDCNGWSPVYRSVKPSMRALCTDPVQIKDGHASRFVDNGWYVGHDEPSVKFISNAAGSGNTMTYYMQLPVDPTKKPTANGKVTKYGELSIAPWFGLPLCDPHSYPQNPCTPDSDSNSGVLSNPKSAGSAFMELQFYPPGFADFEDSFSCSQTYWCGALTIDSLECNFDFAKCNTGCEEPTNASYLQRNGVPTGPPSPQLADVDTDFPNDETLQMHGGDVLKISITDPPAGLTTTVDDLTTGQSGYMVASAKNGFMDTSIANCDGRPFTFHAEYSTARAQNQVPWAALEGGVIMEEEVGHFETCNAVIYKLGINVSDSNGQSYHDPDAYQTCVGGTEGSKSVGEGPCNLKTLTCRNSSTEGTAGPQPCPTNSPVSGDLCEFADGYCFPAGNRTVTINGKKTIENWPVAGCNADAFQNGDLDFDGIPYQPGTWPNGTADQPTAVRYMGPFEASGAPYPTIQFETDIAGSEFLCNTVTGQDCDAPPLGSEFYPFYSLNDTQTLKGVKSPSGACVWNFGNILPGVTTRDFGKDAEYGSPDTARYGGTVISAPRSNPEFDKSCPSFDE